MSMGAAPSSPPLSENACRLFPLPCWCRWAICAAADGKPAGCDARALALPLRAAPFGVGSPPHKNCPCDTSMDRLLSQSELSPAPSMMASERGVSGRPRPPLGSRLKASASSDDVSISKRAPWPAP